MHRGGTLRWRLGILWGSVRVAFGAHPRVWLAYRQLPEPLWQRVRHLFKPPPPSPPPRPYTPPPWSGEPDFELGVAVPARRVLVSNPDIAVALIDCVAYSTGFKFSLVVRTKAELNPRAMGFSPTPYSDVPAEEQLQFGVRFADGREDRCVFGMHNPGAREYFQAIQEGREPEIPKGPVIGPRGGGGGGRRWDFSYWVWPLPPDGPVTITLEWPRHWDGAVTSEVDGTAIHKAGESSERLW